MEPWEREAWAFELPNHGIVTFVTENFYREMTNALERVHRHDLEWAQATALSLGVDLDALSKEDPTYRAEFRADHT